MISIDNLNIILTGISILVTLVSIGLSIWSFNSAKKAEQYKKETLQIRDTFDLEGLLSRFQTESKYFLNNTRRKDWYKGIDINSIISPFKEVLSVFGRLYHLVKDANTLRDKVYTLNEIVEIYDKANSHQKRTANQLIFEVIEILQQEVHNNACKIVKGKSR